VKAEVITDRILRRYFDRKLTYKNPYVRMMAFILHIKNLM